MRQCRAPAREADLPSCTRAVVYTGKAHGNDRLAECTWSPADCPTAGTALVTEFEETGYVVLPLLTEPEVSPHLPMIIAPARR